jgi:Domain of unknown function (DUF4838)/Glycosyl hydrolase family 67 N-terminus
MPHHRRAVTLALVGLALAAAFSAAQGAEPAGVDLAKLSGWDVVIAEEAPPAVTYAAEELRSLVGQATGVELPITSKPNRPDRHVFVGPSKSLADSSVAIDAAALGAEALRIVVRDNLIAIAGGSPRGTLYGVYTFVEDYFGVRFLTADHTHVPKLSTSTVVGPVDRTYASPLSFRWTYYGETNRSPMFAARLRINTIGGDARYGGTTGQSLINHSFGAQLPEATYGKEHPEYFALRDGKRLGRGKDDWGEAEPCFTNPEVRKIVTQAVLANLKAHPGKENISVSQNDNNRNCLCPECRAIDEREGTPMGTLLQFVNAVADDVAHEYPQVKIGTLSYLYTLEPPKTIKPRPNVQIQLCSIECCMLHPINDPKCEKNVRFCQDMDRWATLTKNIFIWNYNTNFRNYLLPCPNLRVIEPNVRYFVANGAKGIFMQAAGNATGAELSDLRNYVMASLLWDPTRDGQKLLDEFLDLHYAKAAPPIRRFINLYHNHCQSQGIHRNCFGRAKDYAVDEQITRAAMDAFGEALTLADDEAVKARVEKASICAYRCAIDPAWETPHENAPVAPDLAAKVRPHARHFAELCAKHNVQMFNEHMTIDEALERLREILGVKPGEAL